MGVWIEIDRYLQTFGLSGVTPCVGVWIEIITPLPSMRKASSLPAWECGLKYSPRNHFQAWPVVTPCVGVWIEMPYTPHQDSLIVVTPCVGVWIEIGSRTLIIISGASHSLRGSVD